jgi:hypothetical protein
MTGEATFKNNTYTFATNAINIAPNQAIVLLDMRLIENNPPYWWHHWNGTVMTPELCWGAHRSPVTRVN